jgi:8-oxo-dGTP pyrophosphatase MutT (NUDIX family)
MAAAVLSGEQDRYRGLTVKEVGDYNEGDFEVVLRASVEQWERDGVRGVWIHLNPLKNANLFSVLLRNGFAFHHAHANEAVLTKWLPKETSSSLPSYTTHYIGAGGLVFHPHQPYHVLVISESFETQRRLKLPGGLVDHGESIAAGAVREVREETGVLCDVSTARIVIMRDRQDAPFGKSDLYIIVSLEALSVDITPCPKEVSMCAWMDVREILADEHIYPFNRAMFSIALAMAEDREAKKNKSEGENETNTAGGLNLRSTNFPPFWNRGAMHHVYAHESFVPLFDLHKNSKF